MATQIKKIQFLNFRNYQNLTLDNIQQNTVFIGENAVGKTNIIEGIQLLTALCSFKKPQTQEIITYGQTQAYLKCYADCGGRNIEISMSVEGNKKTYFLNKKKKTKSEIAGLLPSVVFSPDDLFIIKGPPSKKRDLIDNIGYQSSKNYAKVLSDYKKVVKQKNLLLKNSANQQLIESVNDILLVCASQLYIYRLQLVKNILPLLQKIFLAISNKKEDVSIEYIPSWDRKQNKTSGTSIEEQSNTTKEQVRKKIDEAIQLAYVEENIRKQTLIGPHKDQIIFTLNGRDAVNFASQGQQRSIMLAIKLAEKEIISKYTGQQPVLLLDDVMSELDETRRKQLLSLLRNNVQTFITTTTLSYFPKETLQDLSIIKLPLQ